MLPVRSPWEAVHIECNHALERHELLRFFQHTFRLSVVSSCCTVVSHQAQDQDNISTSVDMSTRKLNALERTLHHAALVKPDKARLHGCSLAETLNRQLNEFALCIQVLTAQELEGLAPDPNARLAVVNFLLGTVSSYA